MCNVPTALESMARHLNAAIEESQIEIEDARTEANISAVNHHRSPGPLTRAQWEQDTLALMDAARLHHELELLRITLIQMRFMT